MSDETNKTAGAQVFSFGDPESILDRREIFDYMESPLGMNGKWYEPPISFEGLAKLARAAVHHASAMQVKRNALVSTYIPHKLLSRTNFARIADEFQIFGNAYLERRRARSGTPLELLPSLARYTRRGADLETYWWVPSYKQEKAFPKGEVFHLLQPDFNQEIYGMPEYLPAMHSALLNESATLFRRRYYQNGSHAGFIFYMSDPAQKDEDIDAIRNSLKNAKGVGNFKNLFMYSPNGKKDGIQIIPLAEVAAKDEFLNIKNVTRDDQLSMHRVPPELIAVVPNNTRGFNDPEKVARVFNVNEIGALQARLLEINDWMGEEVVRFKDYDLAQPSQDQKN